MDNKITLISENGENLGDFSLNDAKNLAKNANKDIVLVNKEKNVYKIADIGKMKYEKKQKEKQRKANQRNQKIKEIKLKPLIELHDLEVKYNYIMGFLKDGHRTKLMMQFKGRMIDNKDMGIQKFNVLVQKLISNNLATIDKNPSFEGNNLVVILLPPK